MYLRQIDFKIAVIISFMPIIMFWTIKKVVVKNK